MRIEYHPLDGAPIGSTRFVTALHFGAEDAPRKIYIQTSLHADELPGALTAYHLRPLLEAVEAAGRLNAHIVLVPMCNPIGLAQAILYEPSGRFDWFTGQNFNRLTQFPLYERALAKLQDNPSLLGKHADENVAIIRRVMREVIDEFQPSNQAETLQKTLVGLAFDADVVLDLHCDEVSVMHLYTLPQSWSVAEPLARLMGSECQLLSENSGSSAFDEFLSTSWLRLGRDFPEADIPCACTAVTVELRGKNDLTHALAQRDAQAIVQYLTYLDDIESREMIQLPQLLRPPHPLSGLHYSLAPSSGLSVYAVKAGDKVRAGQEIVQIIDAVHDMATSVCTPIDGFVFATHRPGFVQQGALLASISGAVDLGLGDALGP